MNNLKFFIIFVFLLTSNAFGKELKFSKEVPLLYKLLITEAYQTKEIKKSAIGVTNSLLQRNQGDFSFIENEIIKYTLSYSKTLKKGFKVIDHKMYESVKVKVSSISKERPFTKYLYQSFMLDLSELLTDPELIKYNSYQKNRLFKIDKLTRKFSKKVAMLTPWLRTLISDEPGIYDNKLDIFVISLTDHIRKILELTSRTSGELQSDAKVFISVIDIGLEEARKAIDGLNFEVSPAPNPNYKAPDNLPASVDDWVPVDETIIEDGVPLTKDNLFPGKDPNYTPPKVLPRPVDGWD
ncbi:MAG: hypothetical protein BM556_13635 [Bacteriovorax sp. MedPE-SWde]|nr:MAG: hypothetical protein BM556_13635 [Bacteriovorax sp. MedPE-SWde]